MTSFNTFVHHTNEDMTQTAGDKFLEEVLVSRHENGIERQTSFYGLQPT